MKIVHVVETWTGGIATYVQALAIKQRDLGHDLVLLCDIGKVDGGVHIEGVEVIHYRSSRNPAKFGAISRNLQRCIASLYADVVHCHSSFPGMYVRMRNHPGVRIIYTPHAWSFLKTDVTTPAKWGMVSSNACSRNAVTRSSACRLTNFALRAGIGFRLRRSSLSIPESPPTIVSMLRNKEMKPIRSKLDISDALIIKKALMWFLRRCRCSMQVLSFMRSAQPCAGESTQESTLATTPASRITAGSTPPGSGAQCRRWTWSWCPRAGRGSRSSLLRPCGRARSLLYPEKARCLSRSSMVTTASSSAN